MPKILMTARLGPMRSWIIELWRRSAHVRMAARFRTNMTITRILMKAQTICMPFMASLRARVAGDRLRRPVGLGRRAPDELPADLLQLRPRRLEAERGRQVGHLLPRRLAGPEGLERL